MTNRNNWIVPHSWPGETCFIVGGGPSVADQNTDLLMGRNTIVINSSFQRMPWANFCIWQDSRWFHVHREELRRIFTGTVVTAWATQDSYCKVLRRVPPPLNRDPTSLAFNRTTTTSAIHLAVHLGAKRIVLLGIDQQPDGDRYHHHEPHIWPVGKGAYGLQTKEFSEIAPQLTQWGIDVINASPRSKMELWPKRKFEECL